MEFDLKFVGPAWPFVPLLLRITFIKIFIEVADSSSSSTLQITTVIVGQRFQFECIGNSSETKWIDWAFYNNSQLNETEYLSPCPSGAKAKNCLKFVNSGRISSLYTNRYNVSNITNGTIFSSTLSVEAVDLSYAGAYQCYDPFTFTTNYYFLTVIDQSSSRCTQTADSNNFRCSFAFSGRQPNFLWIWKNSIGSLDCVQEEFNNSWCRIQFPLMFPLKEIISCRLAFSNTSANSELVETTGYSEIISIKITVSNSSSKWGGFLKCAFVEFSEPPTSTDGTSINIESTYFILVVIAIISGIVVLAIVVVLFRLKRVSHEEKGAKKSDAKGRSQAARTNTNTAEPTYSYAGQIDYESEASVYSDVKKERNDQTNPTYSEPEKKKSKNKTLIYAEVKNKVSMKGKNSKSQPDFVIAETGIYNCPLGIYEQDTANKPGLQNTQKNVEPDGVIYSELQTARSKEPAQQRPVFQIREGFDRSVYAAVDHTFQAPPPPPPQKAAHR